MIHKTLSAWAKKYPEAAKALLAGEACVVPIRKDDVHVITVEYEGPMELQRGSRSFSYSIKFVRLDK